MKLWSRFSAPGRPSFRLSAGSEVRSERRLERTRGARIVSAFALPDPRAQLQRDLTDLAQRTRWDDDLDLAFGLALLRLRLWGLGRRRDGREGRGKVELLRSDGVELGLGVV